MFRTNPRRLVDEQCFKLIRLYHQCDRGMAGHVWPKGELLDQPNVLIEAWSVIGQALERAKKGEPQ